MAVEGNSLRLSGRWVAQLLFFIVVTIWLAAIYPSFLRRFLMAMTVLLAVNAVVNISAFVSAPIMPPLDSARLGAIFGTPGFRNATHVAPLFAIYAMAALALAATERLLFC